MPLLRVPAKALDALARQVRITDHDTGTTELWVPHAEQRKIWQVCAKRDWVFAAKPRRIGATTAVELDDLIWCAVNDAAGNRVRCGLFVDTDEKSRERVALARSIIDSLPDLFIGADINSERVLFSKGSVLEFHTGSGQNAGRGGGYQRLHVTELPFFLNRETLGALLPAMSRTSQVIIETTIDVTGPNGISTRQLWRDPANRFERIFFSVEEHEDYRLPASAISDDDWAYAQDEGFTIREAAAWWLRDALPNLCAGDLNRLMREFPQTEAHLFSSAAGLWVKTTPRVIKPVKVIDIEGHILEIFIPLEQTSGQVTIGVDVSKGSGRDASVIAVVDKYDHRLCAMLHDNTITTPVLARAARVAQREYTIPPRALWADMVVLDGYEPEIAYETNGVGTGPCQYAREIGLSVVDVSLAGAEGQSIMYDVLLTAKQRAEDGTLAGPKQLAIECDELHRDPTHGRWVGRKDGLVAYGHACRRARINPFVPPKPLPPKRSKIVDVESLLEGDTGPEW